MTSRTPWRSHLKRLTPLLALVVVAGGAATTPAGAQSDPGQDVRAYDSDPRSGAALNREWAIQAAPGTAGSESAPQRINRRAVNDPSADNTAQDTQSETTIAVDGDDVVVAWNDSGSFIGGASHFTGYANSTDRGTTFTDRGALPNSAEGDAGDPVLAVDRTSHVFYLATLGFNTGENLQVFRSTDGGETFGAPVNGTPGYAGSGNFQDKEWMTVDNFAGGGQGNVYLCWTNFASDAEIRFTRSTDGGATFGPNTGTLIAGEGAQNQGCYVVVGPDHTVYVFYFRGAGGDNKLWVRRSTDQGNSFSGPTEVADLLTSSINGNLSLNGGLRSNSFPHAAVNPVSGQLYVVFNDNPDGADAADSYVVTSEDNGATWSPRAQVNDDDQDRDQFFPTVGVNEAGNQVMVGYYSRLHDPANFAFHRRGRQARVDDAGELKWRESFQMGPDTPIVIGQDPVINPTYMGDYDQIASEGKHFFSSWADNRDGNSFHANQPDVFHARVRVRPKATNVAVSVTAPDNVPTGEQFTIEVTATNTGSDTSHDVYLSDVLPNKLAVQDVSIAGGGCDRYGQLVACRVGRLLPGESETMKVTVKGTAAGTYSNDARVTTSSRDSDNGDDSDSESITIT